MGYPSLERFGLLASALAGRSVDVEAGTAGEATWTDGQRILIDPALDRTELLRGLTLQACLLASDSLRPDVLADLARRPRLRRRYLRVEGARALASQYDLLPPSVRAVTDRQFAVQTDSPRHSLTIAASRVSIEDPPGWFGELRPRAVRLEPAAGGSATSPTGAWHQPRRGDAESLRALDDERVDEKATDQLSSPVGGGGGIGKLLGRLLSERRGSGGGPPGADTPTHRAGGDKQGRGTVRSTIFLQGHSLDGAPSLLHHADSLYPEWDVHHQRYRPDWCTVREVPLPHRGARSTPLPDSHATRRALGRVGLSLEPVGRQLQGVDIDIDAAVEARVNELAGAPTDGGTYIDLVRRRRDLAVLVLLDVSGSGGEPAAAGGTVHAQQQAATARLARALHDLGVRVALYGFRSQGRSSVQILPFKRFDQPLGREAWHHLSTCTPRAYTRLGAAIRHASRTLDHEAATSRRVLLVVSDGFAYDHGYEGAYGQADARRALTEARRRGIGCICVSVGALTDARALREVFGSAAYASLSRVEQLPLVIAPMFRYALRTAAAQRRMAQRRARTDIHPESERIST
jgi:nitric oxide reductase NorD protein